MDGTGASEDIHDHEHVDPVTTGGPLSLLPSEADGDTGEASQTATVTSTHGGSGELRQTMSDSITIEGDLGGAHTTHGLETSDNLHGELFQPPSRSALDHRPDGDLGGAHGEAWGFESGMVLENLSSPTRSGFAENAVGQMPEIAFDVPPTDSMQTSGQHNLFFNADFSSGTSVQADGATGEASQTPAVTSTHGGSGELRHTVIDSLALEGDLGGAHTTHGLESSGHDPHDEFFPPPERSPDGDLGGAHGETWGFESNIVVESSSSSLRDASLENNIGIVGDSGGAYVASRTEGSMNRSPEVSSNGNLNAQFCGDIGGSPSLPSAGHSPAPGGSGSNLNLVTSSSDDPGSTPTQNANSNHTRDEEFGFADFTSVPQASTSNVSSEANQIDALMSSHGGSGELRQTVVDSTALEGDSGGAHTAHALESSGQQAHQDSLQPSSRSNVDGDLGGAHGEAWGFESNRFEDSHPSVENGSTDDFFNADFNTPQLVQAPENILAQTDMHNEKSEEFGFADFETAPQPSALSVAEDGVKYENCGFTDAETEPQSSTIIVPETKNGDEKGCVDFEASHQSSTVGIPETKAKDDEFGFADFGAVDQSSTIVAPTIEDNANEFRFAEVDEQPASTIVAQEEKENDGKIGFADFEAPSHSSTVVASETKGDFDFADFDAPPSSIGVVLEAEENGKEIAVDAPPSSTTTLPENNAKVDAEVCFADFDAPSSLNSVVALEGKEKADEFGFADHNVPYLPESKVKDDEAGFADFDALPSSTGAVPSKENDDDFGFADFNAPPSSTTALPESKHTDDELGFTDFKAPPSSTIVAPETMENDKDVGFADFDAPSPSTIVLPESKTKDDEFGFAEFEAHPSSTGVVPGVMGKDGEADFGDFDAPSTATTTLPESKTSNVEVGFADFDDPPPSTVVPETKEKDKEFGFADFDAPPSSTVDLPETKAKDDEFGFADFNRSSSSTAAVAESKARNDEFGFADFDDPPASTIVVPASNVEVGFADFDAPPPSTVVPESKEHDKDFGFAEFDAPPSSTTSLPETKAKDDEFAFADFDAPTTSIGVAPESKEKGGEVGFADFDAPPSSTIAAQDDEFGFADFDAPPSSIGVVFDSKKDDDVSGFADFDAPPSSTVGTNDDKFGFADFDAPPSSTGFVPERTEKDDEIGFADFDAPPSLTNPVAESEEKDDEFGFADFESAPQPSGVEAPVGVGESSKEPTNAVDAKDDFFDDDGFDDFSSAPAPAQSTKPVEDEDDEFDDFSSAPAFAKPSAADDGDDDFDDFSSAPAFAQATTSVITPAKQDCIDGKSTSIPEAVGPSITAEVIVERWCQTARKRAPCHKVFQYLPDGCKSESQIANLQASSWQDCMSSYGSSIPPEAQEFLSSGISAKAVPTIPPIALGLGAAGTHLYSQGKSQVREVFFGTLGKHLQLPPPKGFETADPSKEATGLAGEGLDIEADGVDRLAGQLPIEAHVSAPFPTMPSSPSVPPGPGQTSVNNSSVNNSSTFGDDWGVFASSGPAPSTTSTTISPAFDDPFGSFSNASPSRPPVASSASTGGDLLSGVLGEFGLQTTTPAAENTNVQFNFPGVSSGNSLLGDTIVQSNDYPPRVKSFLESLPNLSHLYSSTIVS